MNFTGAGSFTVKPFSGVNYRKNQHKCGIDQEPCAICGKPVDGDQFAVMACVIDGGASWGDPNLPDGGDTAGGFMGFYPVGSGCARKYRVKS